MKKILIFGGSGYVGSKLIIDLIKKYKIINYDKDLYGKKHLPFNHKNYCHFNGDIRDYKKIKKVLNKEEPDEIIHLACISNDPSFVLNKNLSREVNYESFVNLLKILKFTSIQKFLFVSTCSVYGISDIKNIKEDHELKPITLYNKYKAECEKVLQDATYKNFRSCIIRPATVCGLSPKMRYDLSVNILTNYAYHKGFIKVFGGEQKRPNIHIDDVVRLYSSLVENDFFKINGEVFNAGHENLTINQIAIKVKEIAEKIKGTPINIIIEKSVDNRSYHINSEKIKKKLKFYPKKTVSDAIEEICKYFKNQEIKDTFSNINYFNVEKLKKINFR
jgi:nucleoside-diphosphate-sugar epimerase